MDDRYAMTDELTRRARRVDARAVTRGDIVAPLDAGGGAATAYPRFFREARGAHVWDVDGNRYVDYLLGYGAVLLGHADPRVAEAIVRELGLGSCVSPLWSPRQVELTELLWQVVPGAERALLLKTGSDATSAAVRLARVHTGRSRVARWGYNGWHDWSVEQPAGVPSAVRSLSWRFDPKDPAGLERWLREHDGEVACVVMMPFEHERTDRATLLDIRRITQHAGVLLVLDEMRSGFRMALGGAQEYFGVRADLATFSKAMANGHAISAVTGPAEIMDGLRETKISSTFFASPLEMAAAVTTLTVLRDGDALEVMWQRGEALLEGLRELAQASPVEARVVGYGPMPFVEIEDASQRQSFFAYAAAHGLLLHPDHQWFVSAAHTERDIAYTLEICAAAFDAIATTARG